MSQNREPIVALVAHARRVPAVERKRFADRFRARLSGRALILETCHRVEAYVADFDESDRVGGAEALPAGGRMLIGDECVRHAVTVAVGRDSVVAGEDQILHQLRASVEAARVQRSLDPVLERLFALALRAGRRARSWRQGPERSLADVALSEIERGSDPLRGRAILVVGAGRIGRLAARAAMRADASVAIANRSVDGAEALATSTGARVEGFDPGPSIGRFAGVIVALAGPWPIRPATIDALARSSTIVIDLSVPAAVPEQLATLLGTRLVTADDLAHVESDLGQSLEQNSGRLDKLIEAATAEFLAWLDGRDRRAAAEALVQRADREREAELAALWRRLPDLDPAAREAIERMSRHLAGRLLRPPLERLGRDRDGQGERAVREIFAL